MTGSFSISGSADWRPAAFHLPPGTNRLSWVYAKDASYSKGADAGWLDDVSFLPGAIVFLSNPPATLDAHMGDSVNLICSVTAPLPLQLQWTRDSVALTDAIESTLVLTNLGRRDAGTYVLVATDGINTATSEPALLNVAVPQRLSLTSPRPGEPFRLMSVDANGGLLMEGDLARIEIQSSEDLVTWTAVTNGVTLRDGLLRVEEPDFATRPARFLRAVEK